MMVFTANQLVAHAVGDYVLQSDYMANNKTKQSFACFLHVVFYALPFVLMTRSPSAVLFIAGTHFVIDRWRLARFVCWAKNFLGPRSSWAPWSDCVATGYPSARPPWLSVWLLIIADNLMHVCMNAVALNYL
ncbi:MAG: DUF3307 domain-containing protein [Anaerolineae bacterium]|nr:MAG: DUF3307 domain-containing protein [Anaerolineae bacterium]